MKGKKIWQISLLLFVLSSGVASASLNTYERHPTIDGYNKAVRPIVEEGNGVFLRGEFLYWRAHQDDLQFGAIVTDTLDPRCGAKICHCPNNNSFLACYSACVLDPDFKATPGFRVGAGYNSSYDGWDVSLIWTRLNSTARNCTQATCPSHCTSESSCKPYSVANSTFCCDIPHTCTYKDNPCDKRFSKSDCNFCKDKCYINSFCGPCNPGLCTKIVPSFAPCRSDDNFETTVYSDVKWKLRLNLLDLEVGREYFVGNNLTMRPHLGLRAGWIKQDYCVNYITDIHVACPECPVFFLKLEEQNQNDPTLPGCVPMTTLPGCVPMTTLPGCVPMTTLFGCQTSCNDFKNEFKGVGPRFGINTDWILGAGFAIYGKAAISLLYGNFDVDACICKKLCVNELECSYKPPAEQADAKVPARGEEVKKEDPYVYANSANFYECASSCACDSFTSSKAATDLAIGLQWQHSFSDDNWALRIQLGWDHLMLFEQNQLWFLKTENNILELSHPNGNTYQMDLSPRRRGSLSVQGLTLSMQLDF